MLGCDGSQVLNYFLRVLSLSSTRFTSITDQVRLIVKASDREQDTVRDEDRLILALLAHINPCLLRD